MGPQHPSTHGVLRVILKLDGEKVTGTECVIGYLHRGVEKIAENRTYAMFAPYVDRMDYVAAVSNGLGYCLAVEKLLNVEAPPRAQVVRVILTELNRIASHLLWLGTHALDIGAITPLFYCMREREDTLNIFEKYCGARLTTHAFRIGGLQYETLRRLRAGRACEFCDMFLPKVDEYEELLTGNRIWMERLTERRHPERRGLQGLRRHRPDAARGRREVGPAQGAALLRLREVRLRDPHRHERRHLRPVHRPHGGDAAERAHHPRRRWTTSRTGPSWPRCRRCIKPPVGEAYVSIEAPKGELGYYIVSDGSTQPYRVRVRPPSFVNLQSLDKMARGALVADLVAIIGTIDIVLGEVDR